MGINQSTNFKKSNNIKTINISNIDYEQSFNTINKDYKPIKSNNTDYSIIKREDYYNKNDYNNNTLLVNNIKNINSKFIIVNDQYNDINYNLNTINYIPNINKNQHIMLYYTICCKGRCWFTYTVLNDKCKQIYDIITNSDIIYNFVFYCENKNVFNYGNSLIKLLELYKLKMMKYDENVNKNPITEKEFNIVINYIKKYNIKNTTINDIEKDTLDNIDQKSYINNIFNSVNDDNQNKKEYNSTTNSNTSNFKLKKKIIDPKDICILCNDCLLNNNLSLIILECGHYLHKECQEEYRNKCSNNIYCLQCNI